MNATLTHALDMHIDNATPQLLTTYSPTSKERLLLQTTSVSQHSCSVG